MSGWLDTQPIAYGLSSQPTAVIERRVERPTLTPFEKYKAFVLANEGGFVETNKLWDPGGHTYAGIARRFNEDWSGWRAIDLGSAPSREEVWQVYRRYWNKVKGDRLAEMAPYLAIAVADHGFHAGPGRAVMDLQRVLGVKADGIVGPQTLGALRKVLSTKGEEELLALFAKQRNKTLKGRFKTRVSYAISPLDIERRVAYSLTNVMNRLPHLRYNNHLAAL